MGWDGDEYQRRFDIQAAAGEDVHGEATFVMTLSPRSVLDVGCGTGRVAIELARRGVEVVGVDNDHSMVATARERAPHLEWLETDATTLDLGRVFDVVVMAGNVPLFTAPGTNEALVAACARHVAPGGALVAGFQLDGRYGLADYDAAADAAGLRLIERYATWDRRPFPGDGSYAVSVSRPEGVPSRPGAGDARRLAVERNLAASAFHHLTVDAFANLPFEALGPTKALLKRFFSHERWSDGDDDALADAVGRGEGHWRRALDDDVVLEYGWIGGRFEVRLTTESTAPASGRAASPLDATFEGPVVPEATPNPRTIRFQTGPIHQGPSRWYASAAEAADDPAASRLFAEFADVANVLVGPDFVAVGLRRAADWERLLRPVLALVTDEFASADGPGDGPSPVRGGPAGAGATGSMTAPNAGRPVTQLDRAWRELGSLRPAKPQDLSQVLAAAASTDQFRRQVAASLLREAEPSQAGAIWAQLIRDRSRSVRRAAVDAIVDVGRDELRPLLENALHDSDAWVRWKAVRGLVELGPAPSHQAIAALADDPDFRVRLEVTAALRS